MERFPPKSGEQPQVYLIVTKVLSTIINSNSTKIHPRLAEDSIPFQITVIETATYTEYERIEICDCYGQKPGKSIKLWLVYLGDEGEDSIFFSTI